MGQTRLSFENIVVKNYFIFYVTVLAILTSVSFWGFIYTCTQRSGMHFALDCHFIAKATIAAVQKHE